MAWNVLMSALRTALRMASSWCLDRGLVVGYRCPLCNELILGDEELSEDERLELHIESELMELEGDLPDC